MIVVVALVVSLLLMNDAENLSRTGTVDAVVRLLAVTELPVCYDSACALGAWVAVINVVAHTRTFFVTALSCSETIWVKADQVSPSLAIISLVILLGICQAIGSLYISHTSMPALVLLLPLTHLEFHYTDFQRQGSAA